VVPFPPVRSVVLVPAVIALGAALALVACAPVDSPRRSSNSPTLRCMNDPGHGQSLDSTRPLFFLFCSQSP